MLQFFLIILLLPTAAIAMCEYPHNPPAVCLSGKVSSVTGMTHSQLACRYQVQVTKLLRPAHTYRYNDKLELINFLKNEELKNKTVTLYSKIKPCAKIHQSIQTLAIYNCSDWYPEIPDLELVDFGSKKGSVRDPWKGSSTEFDCEKILTE